jgi:predicted RNA binding protein YcfA (HicA-like mRNA interferase family)
VKLPRDLSGADLVRALGRFGYQVTRQRASHIRLTTQQNGEHHVTVPDHARLRIGTLAGVLRMVSEHLGMSKDELVSALFDD